MPTIATARAEAVEPVSAETIEVGAQIRELRRVKGLTLQHVADAAGISVGYLSQIERNQSKLPIGVLKRIGDTLGVHMSWFFHVSDVPDNEKNIVVRASHRRKFSFTGIGIEEELLSPNLSGQLEMLLSTIEPGADSGEYSHDGEEAGYVLSGKLHLWVAGQFFELDEGDSFSFKSTEVHRCANPGSIPTKIVWIITPPFY